MRLVELRDVSRSYKQSRGPEVQALRNVSLTIEEGEFVAIVGPSGGGKSTLLNVLGLLDDPSSGEYIISGERAGRVSQRHAARLRARHIAFIFQAFHLLERRPAIDSVGLNLLYRGVPARVRRAAALRAISAVGLVDSAWQNTSTLSGGQRQRIAIARAMAGDARLVLADEPTGNLDSANAELVLDELERVNRNGAAVVIVTHSSAVAARADRIVRIVDGSVVADPGSRVSASPERIAGRLSDAAEKGSGRPRRRIRGADVIADAWASISSRKIQTMAQCLAVLIAVGLSVTTFGLSATARSQVSETFDAHLNREVSARLPAGLPHSSPFVETVASAKALVGVEAAAVVVDLSATDVSSISTTRRVQPHLVVGDFEAAGRVKVDRAAWDRGGLNAGEAYVGDLLAQDLELAEIGSAPTIEVAGERYVVAGIITDSGRLPLWRGEIVISAAAVSSEPELPEANLLVTTMAGAAPQVADQLAVAINPFAPDRISVVAPTDDSRLRGQIEAGVQAALVAFTILALLVAVAALVNTTLMAVNARRGEIGMRKALGATERNIASLITTESVCVGLLGGVAGLFVGMIAILIVTVSHRWAPVFDLWLMPLAVAIGVGTACLGGVAASIRAAKLPPAENLQAR